MALKTRNLLMWQRSQPANALRAHLAELGIIAAAGMTSVCKLIERPRSMEDNIIPEAGVWR